MKNLKKSLISRCLVPDTHPANHGSIASDQTYPIIPVFYRGGIFTAVSIKLTTWTPISCFPRFILITSLDLIICVSPLLVWPFSDDVIVCLYLNSALLMWKIAKRLTQRLKLQRIKFLIFAISFSSLPHWQSWKAYPEPVPGLGHRGLS